MRTFLRSLLVELFPTWMKKRPQPLAGQDELAARPPFPSRQQAIRK